MPPADANKNTVVLFKGETVYDSMRVMTDEIGEGFRRLGYRPESLDLIAPGHSEALMALFERRDLAFFFGFNAWGVELSRNGRSLFEVTAAPMFKFFLDHPMFGISRVTSPTTTSGLLCFTCANQAQFVAAVTGDALAPQVIAHGAVTPVGAAAPIASRDLEIVFAGSVVPPHELEAGWDRLTPGRRAVLSDSIDHYLAHMDGTFIDAILAVLDRRGLSWTDFGEANFAHVAIELDRYLQARLRYTTMDSLGDLPLHVYGSGWEGLASENRRARYHPAVGFKQVMALMGRAKLVLHALPYYYESHERVFNGMAHGAAVVSSHSNYFARTFKAGRDLQFYGFGDADLADRLDGLLSDEERLAGLADSGRRACLAAHTWHHRAVEVERLVRGYRSGGQGRIG